MTRNIKVAWYCCYFRDYTTVLAISAGLQPLSAFLGHTTSLPPRIGRFHCHCTLSQSVPFFHVKVSYTERLRLDLP